MRMMQQTNHNKINYDLMMQKTAETHKGSSLLLHACCAPCSSAVISRLAPYFALSIFYYNPNIDTEAEYKKRLQELDKLTFIFNKRNISCHKIELIASPYTPLEFDQIAQGLQFCKEGGERCHLCYALRLAKTYEMAKTKHFNFFCSTLSVSPYKNAHILNEIGTSLVNPNDETTFLPNDFKKRDGYLTSIRLSREFQLYRQDYCGCIYSKQSNEKREE